MTSQSPRIYIYKITFEEVLYYYYGVHKERKYNEYYMGSPVTHKWCWDFYTPKKQILEVFPFTDNGWMEAQEVEKRIIKLVYDTDKWCLNENVGGQISLNVCRKNGNNTKNNKSGIFSLSKEDWSKNSKKAVEKSHKIQREYKTGFFNSKLQSELGKRGGTKTKERGVGIFAISPEEKSRLSREIGLKMRDDKKGIFSLTKEQLSENALKNKERGIGMFSLSQEQKSAIGKKNGRNTGKQRWICLETGHITTPGPLTLYQRAKGIDTSKRKRIT